MINETGFDPTPSERLAFGAKSLPGLLAAPVTTALAQPAWGRWLTWIGRGCLVVFAAVALISANRESGLLTLGALVQISSTVRGGVPVGIVFLLLPVGATLWLAGRWLLRRGQAWHWSLGPLPVVAPLSILVLLTLARLSPAIGLSDVMFVVAGLCLLILAYLFVFLDGPSGPELASILAIAGTVQALVGVGQFISQHDLGLGWLGELHLNPSAVGVSVLANPARILRAYGLMRHPNALGAILSLSLLAALNLWAYTRGRQRVLWLIPIVVITAGLVLSFSRSGWIAALAGVGVWLVAGRLPGRRVRDVSLASWAPPVLAVALIVFSAVSREPGLFLGRLLGALGAGTGLEYGSRAERIFSLHNAWMLIQHWPLGGVGTREYVVAVAALLHVTPTERLLVESTPLLLWAELGLAAPLAWLGMGGGLIWLGCRRPRQAPNPDLALATAWIAAVQVVCLFQAFYWPTHELWQGGIWLGLALGLWARSWSSSPDVRAPGMS